MEPPGPMAVEVSRCAPTGSGADRVHGLPIPCDQAAIRLPSFPDPARSRAVTPGPAAASRTTAMVSWARDAGLAGPAWNQPLPVSPKMPTVPGWLQPAASSGVPVLLNAAAVRPVSPQARPAAVLA